MHIQARSLRLNKETLIKWYLCNNAIDMLKSHETYVTSQTNVDE